MLAWTRQNTMQRAMRTVLEWPQSHATSKHYNMITNKYEPQRKHRLGTVSKKLLEGLNRFYGIPTVTHKSMVARTVMCRQDGRVRFPFFFFWTITPNVGQTHKENPNLVRILYMVCTLYDVYKQYNKLHEH